MATDSILPVILSGGSGQRLWPVSRQHYPKQLIAFVSDKSMLQETAARLSGAPFAAPLVICNDDHRFIVAEQFREAGVQPGAIVLEPVGRNTAPAAALAAIMAAGDDTDAVMLVAPSDHLIGRPEKFLDAVRIGADAARAGKLVTFGVTPDRPATGYGYIKKGAALGQPAGCFEIARFTEKPGRPSAEMFIAEGDYLWNSGIFMFTAERYLEVLGALRPDMVAGCRAAVDGGVDDLDFFRPDRAAFEACDSESIDYAVMENTDAGVVVPVDMAWNDLGSWSSLWEIGDKDAAGNVILGDVVANGVRDSYLRSHGPLIAAVGLENMMIVATPDAVLVAARDQVEGVKGVVEALQADGRTEHLTHPRVYRPWGWYQTLDIGERFQVKHLLVKPGASLSLQAHKHRAEHWVVVAGSARVTRDDEVLDLEENESTYLPAGTRHRLENPGDSPLSVIEVQSGSYLGEDDIERFEDRYGRD